VTADNKPCLRTIRKSSKLDNVCYDIRGPVMARARQMEEEGPSHHQAEHRQPRAVRLRGAGGNRAGRDPHLPNASGYSDSKGLFSARKAIMHETQRRHSRVQIDDIFIGNGVSELIVMAMQALLNNGDEVLVPAPDYPLWTAAVSLGGGKPRHYLCDEGAAGCPIWTTSAPRSPPTRAPSSSSTPTIRPARCIRPSCCWKSWKSPASTS